VAELAKIGSLDPLRIDPDAFLLQRREHLLEVRDPVIDHVALLAGAKILGVGVKRVPHRRTLLLRVLGVAPGESETTPGLDRQAEMLLVPFAELGRIPGLEEHPAESGDA
jgi:hypothetical protein